MSQLQRKDANNIEACAAAWLERRVSEDWNAEDVRALEAWLAQSWAHRTAYLRLEAAWTRADRLSALRRPVSERDKGRGAALKPALKIAAIAIAAIAMSAGAALLFLPPGETTYATAVGAHKTINLADGSRIELNTDTVLRIAQSGSRRTVWLDRGEAFFQVRHDASRPFVVATGARRITDLGTKFVVRRDHDQLQVAVVEGRVRLDTGERGYPHSALLTRGDVAIAKTNTMSVTKKSPMKLANELGWRRGVLVFDHTTLAAAAQEFNRYNREKLFVADPVTGRLAIYGTFPTGDVKAFTRVAQQVLGLHVESLGSESVISR